MTVPSSPVMLPEEAVAMVILCRITNMGLGSSPLCLYGSSAELVASKGERVHLTIGLKCLVCNDAGEIIGLLQLRQPASSSGCVG